MQTQTQTQTQTPLLLQGRVFARHRAFLRLPEREQRQTHALATFVDQSDVFRARHSGFMRRHEVSGISCDALFDLVLGYLEKHPELLHAIIGNAADGANAAEADDAAVKATGAEDAVGSASASAAASSHSSDHRAGVTVVVAVQRKKQAAWTLVDRLVLSGFLRIDGEEGDPVLGMKLDGFARPEMVFVPAAVTSDPKQVSVWSLRDDTTMAGTLRRANALTKSVGGRDAYFVLDGKRKVLFWFASDAATEPKGHLELSGARVQSCGPHLVDATGFGVKVTARHESLLLLGSAAAEWINPMLGCGAVYDAAPLPLNLSVVSMVIGSRTTGEAVAGISVGGVPTGN